MAQPAQRPEHSQRPEQPPGRDTYQEFRDNPSWNALAAVRYEPWTADLALELLPEDNGLRVEVFHGSVIVTPHAGIDHMAIERDLVYLLHRAARPVGLWALPEINITRGKDLFIPDIAVLRQSGAGQVSVPMSDAVLLGEIVSPRSRRKDVIDYPKEYAAAGVPFFLRIDFRNRVPSLVLHQLIDEEYQPVVAAAAGTTFEMKEPFPFTIDPGELLDE
ncbi:MAG TPA: Uma2 family endonuclease [Pilimelia sp.]|nr:Uma2 family endonuclease [Pilimelia sp.]